MGQAPRRRQLSPPAKNWPHDEPVATDQHSLILQNGSAPSALPPGSRFPRAPAGTLRQLFSSVSSVEMHLCPVLKRGERRAEVPAAHPRGGVVRKRPARGKNHSALNGCVFNAGEIYRRALTRFRTLHAFCRRSAVRALAILFPEGKSSTSSPTATCPEKKCAGHNASESLYREGPVNRQSEISPGILGVLFLARPLVMPSSGPQRTMLGLRADFDDLRARARKVPLNKLFELHARPVSRVSLSTRSLFVSAITPRLHSQQPANIKMLPGLRLDQFVRRDHQQKPGQSRKPPASMFFTNRSCPGTSTKTVPHAFLFQGTRSPDQS